MAEFLSIREAVQHTLEELGPKGHSFSINIGRQDTQDVLLQIADRRAYVDDSKFGFAVVVASGDEVGDVEEFGRLVEENGFVSADRDRQQLLVLDCEDDDDKAVQAAASFLHGPYGVPKIDRLACRVVDRGRPNEVERLRGRIAELVLRDELQTPETASVQRFVLDRRPLIEERELLTERQRSLKESLSEFQQLQETAKGCAAQLSESEKALARFASSLGRATYAAYQAGEVERHAALNERIAVEEKIAELREQHDQLSQVKGILAKTKAKAQQVVVLGKIKLEETHFGSLESVAGSKLIASGEEAAVRCDQTAGIIDQIAEMRRRIEEQQGSLREAEDAITTTKTEFCKRFDRERLNSPADINAAASECGEQIAQSQGKIAQIDAEFHERLQNDPDMPTEGRFGDLVRALRQAHETELQATQPQSAQPQATQQPPSQAVAAVTNVVGSVAGKIAAPAARVQGQQAGQAAAILGAVSRVAEAAKMPSAQSQEQASPVLDPILTGRPGDKANERQFKQCRNALKKNGVDAEDLRLLLNTLVPAPSVRGKPPLHLALTDKEFLLVAVQDQSQMIVERTSLEDAAWSLTDEDGSNSCVRQLAFGIQASQIFTVGFPQGDDLNTLLETSSKVFLQRGTLYHDQQKYAIAQRLLTRVDQDTPAHQQAAPLIEEMGIVATAIVTHNVDAGETGEQEEAPAVGGTLQMDACGLEFTPMPFDEDHYFRYPFDQVRNLAQKKGKFPQEMIQKAQMKKAGGQAVRAAASMARMFSDNALLDVGLSMGGRAAGGALGQSGKLGPPPENRISVIVRVEGEKARLDFCTVGSNREELEKAAAKFCDDAELCRDRFGKRSEQAPSKPSAAEADASKAKQTTTSDATRAPTVTPETKRVVGCPKCGATLRVAGPGIVGCPKCGAKVRVAKELFGSK